MLVGGLLVLAAAACKEDTRLKVTGFDPKRGDYNGGQLVRFYGNRFQADGPRSVKVLFGGRQGNVVRFNGDKELIVQAPGGKPGETVDVLLMFEPGGEAKFEKAFTFVEPAQVNVEDLDIKR